MEDRHLALARRRIGERPDVIRQVVVDGERKQLALMTHGAQKRADAAGAVADGIAAVRRRHPLVHDHGASGGASSGSALSIDGR